MSLPQGVMLPFFVLNPPRAFLIRSSAATSSRQKMRDVFMLPSMNG